MRSPFLFLPLRALLTRPCAAEDWLFWNDEKETKAETAYQLFGMIYLCKTRVQVRTHRAALSAPHSKCAKV